MDKKYEVHLSKGGIYVNGFRFYHMIQMDTIGIDFVDLKTTQAIENKDEDVFDAFAYCIRNYQHIQDAAMLNQYNSIDWLAQSFYKLTTTDNESFGRAIQEKYLNFPFLAENVRNMLIDLFPYPLDAFNSNKKIDIQERKKSIQKHKRVKGFVYIIKSSEGYYKIGKSIDKETRIGTLEVKLPFEIDVEHTIESDDYTLAEKTLHNEYEKKRVRGEWFSLSKKDLMFIKKIKNMNFKQGFSLQAIAA